MTGYAFCAAALLAAGASVGDTDVQGNGALHVAAEAGAHDVLDVLVEGGGDVHAGGQEGNTPLHFACAASREETVAHLISLGGTLMAKNDAGSTALAAAPDAETRKRIQGVLRARRAQGEQMRGLAAEGDAQGLRALLRQPNVLKPDAASAHGTNGRSPIHIAAEGGHAMAVFELLGAGCDPNHKDRGASKATALHYAARGAHLDVATELLDASADAMARDRARDTPLHVLATVEVAGADEEVRLRELMALLVERGASTGARAADGGTPLHRAAAANAAAAAASLLELGALLDVTDAAGQTPYMCCTGDAVLDVLKSEQERAQRRFEEFREAAAAGDEERLRAALANDADPLDLLDALSVDASGRSPVEQAVASGSVACVGLVVDAAERAFATRGSLMRAAARDALDAQLAAGLRLAARLGDEPITSTLLERSTPFEGDSHAGEQLPVAIAAESGKAGVVRILLAAGCGVDSGGAPSLLEAAASGGHAATVKVLLAAGADPLQSSCNNPSDPFLPLSAAPGISQSVRELLDAAALTRSDRTSERLFSSIRKGTSESVAALAKLAVMAGVSTRHDAAGDTVVHAAALHADEASARRAPLDALQVLSDAGVNIDALDAKGRTALFLAASAAMPELVRHLLTLGASPVAAVDPASSRTALHVSAACGSAECVALILRAPGAQTLVDAADQAGDTALHLSMRGDAEHVTALLLYAGAESEAANAAGERPSDYADTGAEKTILQMAREMDASNGEAASARSRQRAISKEASHSAVPIPSQQPQDAPPQPAPSAALTAQAPSVDTKASLRAKLKARSQAALAEVEAAPSLQSLVKPLDELVSDDEEDAEAKRRADEAAALEAARVAAEEAKAAEATRAAAEQVEAERAAAASKAAKSAVVARVAAKKAATLAALAATVEAKAAEEARLAAVEAEARFVAEEEAAAKATAEAATTSARATEEVGAEGLADRAGANDGPPVNKKASLRAKLKVRSRAALAVVMAEAPSQSLIKPHDELTSDDEGRELGGATEAKERLEADETATTLVVEQEVARVAAGEATAPEATRVAIEVQDAERAATEAEAAEAARIAAEEAESARIATQNVASEAKAILEAKAAEEARSAAEEAETRRVAAEVEAAVASASAPPVIVPKPPGEPRQRPAVRGLAARLAARAEAQAREAARVQDQYAELGSAILAAAHVAVHRILREAKAIAVHEHEKEVAAEAAARNAAATFSERLLRESATQAVEDAMREWKASLPPAEVTRMRAERLATMRASAAWGHCAALVQRLSSEVASALTAEEALVEATRERRGSQRVKAALRLADALPLSTFEEQPALAALQRRARVLAVEEALFELVEMKRVGPNATVSIDLLLSRAAELGLPPSNRYVAAAVVVRNAATASVLVKRACKQRQLEGVDDALRAIEHGAALAGMTKDALEERRAHTAAVAYIGELSALQELKGALEALEDPASAAEAAATLRAIVAHRGSSEVCSGHAARVASEALAAHEKRAHHAHWGRAKAGAARRGRRARRKAQHGMEQSLSRMLAQSDQRSDVARRAFAKGQRREGRAARRRARARAAFEAQEAKAKEEEQRRLCDVQFFLWRERKQRETRLEAERRERARCVASLGKLGKRPYTRDLMWLAAACCRPACVCVCVRRKVSC